MSAQVVLLCDAEDALGLCSERIIWEAVQGADTALAAARADAAEQGWRCSDGHDRCPLHSGSNTHSIRPKVVVEDPGSRR